MNSNLTLFISSRARFVRVKNNLFFHRNDGIYINDISKLFSNVHIFADEVDKNKIGYEALELNVNIKCYSKAMSISKFFLIIKLINSSDIIYAFFPLKFSIFITFISKLFSKKIIAYNGAVWSEIRALNVTNSLKKKIIIFSYNTLEYLSVKLADINLVNNNKLYNRYKKVNCVIKASPLLIFNKNDIFVRENTCNNKKCIQLLNVNNVKKGKDIINLIKGFKLLKGKDLDYEVKLKIVGKFDINEQYASKIMNLVNSENLTNEIEFTGIINDKEDLISIYRESDLLILVTESEGFPRVIWEAFSQSLPVVCSPLYNIKIEFNKNDRNIEYFDNNDSFSVCNAIYRVISNDLLRMELIKNGMLSYQKKMNNSYMDQFNKVLKLINKK